MADIEAAVFENETSDLPEEFEHMSAADIERRTRLLDNEVRVLREETQRLGGEINTLRDRIRENKEKIKLNNQLPYLVSNIVEVLDINPDEEDEEDGGTMDVDAQRQGDLHICLFVHMYYDLLSLLSVAGMYRSLH
jgi:26S proteasome regulatory subunit T5